MPDERAWADRSVLVTGAAGFIGSYLCQSLRTQGAHVTALSRSAEIEHRHWDTVLHHDLGDGGSPLQLPALDAVFHLAAHVHELRENAASSASHWKINVEGTKQLLAAAGAARIRRFVYVSTVKVMGESTETVADELTPAAPSSPYGQTKLAAEQFVLEANSPGFESCVLRLPAVYGRGCKGNLVEMFRRVASRRFPPIPEFGNLRSMVHVKDVVRALEVVATHPNAPGGTYIVTDGHAVSTRQLYEAMYAILGREPPAVSIPECVFRAAATMGDVVTRLTGVRCPFDSGTLEKLSGSASYSDAKLRRELGFVSAFDLKAGLTEMVPDAQS